jgi:hypothetical protein
MSFVDSGQDPLGQRKYRNMNIAVFSAALASPRSHLDLVAALP